MNTLKFKIGDRVIVNTGGNDTKAIIDYQIVKPIYYLEIDDAYLCRFTSDVNLTVFGSNNSGIVCVNAQFIPAENIRKEI